MFSESLATPKCACSEGRNEYELDISHGYANVYPSGTLHTIDMPLPCVGYSIAQVDECLCTCPSGLLVPGRMIGYAK